MSDGMGLPRLPRPSRLRWQCVALGAAPDGRRPRGCRSPLCTSCGGSQCMALFAQCRCVNAANGTTATVVPLRYRYGSRPEQPEQLPLRRH